MLLVACAVLGGCRGKGDQAEAVRALIQREEAAINSRDLKGLAEVWSKDEQDAPISLFDVPAPGRFEGWTAIGPLWKSFFERFSDIHMGVEKLRVRVSGDLAYATYDWTLSGRMGDYALDDRGEATEVLRLGKDGWRVVHLHYSARPPEPPPAPAATEPPPTGPARKAPPTH